MKCFRKCKNVGLFAICFVFAEVFRSLLKRETEQNPMIRSKSSLNYKYFIQIPGERTDWRHEVQVFSTGNTLNQKFLTVGIPTVRREKSSYIFDCFDSLLNCTETNDLKEIVFVIYLADFNQTWKEEMAKQLQRKYSKLLDRGTIHVIESFPDFYPQLDNLKHTFNDSEARTKWRSKQNVDFAFLWLYSLYLGKYYLQIEDDVSTIPGYLSIIKKFISEQKTDWTCLEFSEMGFIGKVYQTKDLERLAKTILLFYDKQPVDFLFQYFNSLNLQKKRILRKPTLFRHIGFHSSLPGKTMHAVDKYFDDLEKTIKGDNPRANLFTTLRVSPEFPLDSAYSPKDGYFWAHSAPKVNDTITVVFTEPQNILKVTIITGSREHKKDILEHGRLEACLNIQVSPSEETKCLNKHVIGSFMNGTVHVSGVDQLIKNKIAGLQITVTKSHSYWLIVKEIAVFIEN